jgi:hypothetical protein
MPRLNSKPRVEAGFSGVRNDIPAAIFGIPNLGVLLRAMGIRSSLHYGERGE